MFSSGNMAVPCSSGIPAETSKDVEIDHTYDILVCILKDRSFLRNDLECKRYLVSMLLDKLSPEKLSCVIPSTESLSLSPGFTFGLTPVFGSGSLYSMFLRPYNLDLSDLVLEKYDIQQYDNDCEKTIEDFYYAALCSTGPGKISCSENVLTKVCSLLSSPNIPEQLVLKIEKKIILRSISTYFDKNMNIKTIEEFKNKLSQSGSNSPDAFSVCGSGENVLRCIQCSTFDESTLLQLFSENDVPFCTFWQQFVCMVEYVRSSEDVEIEAFKELFDKFKALLDDFSAEYPKLIASD